MSGEYKEKDVRLLERRFIELSRLSYQREIITYSDFLNLNEQNILHTLPKNSLYSKYVFFGGYETAERQMAAFIPDALSLRCGKSAPAVSELSGSGFSFEEIGYPFQAMRIEPLNKKFSGELTHRDYLGAILNLGIERSKTGDILPGNDSDAFVFVHDDMAGFLGRELTRVRHTAVRTVRIPLQEINYTPAYEEISGSVASVRLDTLLPLAFSSSRSRLSGLIEGAKVFVNGKLVTNNGYNVREGDIISVRGMGKFRFVSTGGQTRKNRVYVLLRKYI